MKDFPKVRWLAGLLMVAFGVVFVGSGFDLAGALGNLGLKAAGIGAALLALGKLIEEAMRIIDWEDPIVKIHDGHIMSRGVKAPSFWRRVL